MLQVSAADTEAETASSVDRFRCLFRFPYLKFWTASNTDHLPNALYPEYHRKVLLRAFEDWSGFRLTNEWQEGHAVLGLGT